jgi:two-component system OmpR family sensor kinase
MAALGGQGTQSIASRLRPRRLRDWTLRSRIIAAMLGLLVILCVLIGTFSDIALHHTLMGRLDAQLTEAGGRFLNNFDQPPGPRGGHGPAVPLPAGQEIGSIGAHIPHGDGGAATGLIRSQAGDQSLSSATLSTLESVRMDGDPHTVSLPGLGAYRVTANLASDGDVLVTGLPLSPVTDTIRNLSVVITSLTLVALIVAGIVGAWIVQLALRPLRRVTATASRVAEMPLDKGEVALAERVPEANPHTEVGQVGVALNRMLENVNDALNARHQSEMRVRQFVADASHELRTPLASIRGYAELTRRSRTEAPPDIAHAMSRVESEAGRMTTLVEDLLLLARLDAGRPLESAEVDLSRLLVDAVSDAHVAGREHRWHLDVPEEPVTVRGDSSRLHQVLTNILANARTHTPPGTAVWTSLTRQGGTAVVEVSDNGPGIPPEQLGNVFERFSRGEQSRSRAAGSTGLGLAIVAAVVTAHGGTISVSSVPGRTVFAVTLPMLADHQAGAQTPASLDPQALQV